MVHCKQVIAKHKQNRIYTHFGPHYPKAYEKGEMDLTELHCAMPRILFELNDPSINSESPEHINKHGYFALDDLHQIAPNYILENTKF